MTHVSNDFRRTVRAGYKVVMGENASPWDVPVAILARILGRRHRIDSKDGFPFIVDLNDRRGAAEYLRLRRTEPPLCALYRRFVRSGDAILDIGSNVGYFAVLAGRLAGGTGRVLALEPTPSTALICRENIQLNGLAEIVALHECAASDAPGEAMLFINPKSSGNNSLLDLDNLGRGNRPGTVTVPVRVVDDLVAGWPGVDLIKIDVEGHEFKTVAGMRRTLESGKTVVVCEVAPRWLRAAGTAPETLFAAFSDHGMRPYSLSGDGSLAPLSIEPFIAGLDAADTGANVAFVADRVLGERVAQGRINLIP